jgi:hypothetical protein
VHLPRLIVALKRPEQLHVLRRCRADERFVPLPGGPLRIVAVHQPVPFSGGLRLGRAREYRRCRRRHGSQNCSSHRFSPPTGDSLYTRSTAAVVAGLQTRPGGA